MRPGFFTKKLFKIPVINRGIQLHFTRIMPKKILLTAFSKDRPGIVADISQVIFENGYNLEDSSMTYLAGEFAILLLLSAPAGADMDEVSENLSSECRRLERDKGITAYIRTVSGPVEEPGKKMQIKTIRVEGFDQTGIVYKVSRFLADSNINIRTLSSEWKFQRLYRFQSWKMVLGVWGISLTWM